MPLRVGSSSEQPDITFINSDEHEGNSQLTPLPHRPYRCPIGPIVLTMAVHVIYETNEVGQRIAIQRLAAIHPNRPNAFSGELQ